MHISVLVTITGREDISHRIQGANAFVLEVGTVSTDVSWGVFALDSVDVARSVTLHVFERYNLPRAKFNGREFCGQIRCSLGDPAGQVVYEVSVMHLNGSTFWCGNQIVQWLLLNS